MTDIAILLKALTEPASNPYPFIRREKERTGKEAVGCFLGFLPEELIYAADLLPIGMWGEDTEFLQSHRYFPAFFCAPIKQMMEAAISGEYTDLLKAMVIPVYCDALRSAGQNFKIAVPNMPMMPIVYPVNPKSKAGMKFLASEYGEVKKKLEELTGKIITDERLEEAVKIYNDFRTSMRDFVKTAGDHPDIISPSVRHGVLKSACYSDKREFTKQLKKLTELIKIQPVLPWTGKKVILTGMRLESPEILAELEKQKIAVIRDYLIQESLQFQTDVPDSYGENKDILIRLATRFGALLYCSVAMDPEKGRIEKIVNEAKDWGAGVIICIPSFCDPEEYDYPLMKKELDVAGVPNVCLEFHTASYSQATTTLQTFAEIW